MDQNEFAQEKQHLQETTAVIRRQLDQAAGESARNAAAIRAIQEERMESNRMDMGGMYSTQGFADILELSQGTLEITQIKNAQDENECAMRTLVQMEDHPYFARIDFRFDAGDTKPIYIGRATLMEKDSLQIHVYDWRVPIASVFYQYGVGPAEYTAPAGTIHGEVLLKRQYEIQRGELQYFFDANEEVRDAFLRNLLSGPAAPAMKSIVETIQRDQDRIIRDMKASLLMVQGNAGSGKTSVALHRVAYLMYEGLQKNRLSAGDIMILAPNATFERYIARVLPDLGEQQVQTMLMEDLLADILPETAIEPRTAWVERWLTETDARHRNTMRRSRSFKGSEAFTMLLERLLYELPRKWIPFADVMYDGKCVAERELSRVTICNSVKKVPLGIQLRMLEKSIWKEIRSLRPARQQKFLAFADQVVQHRPDVSPYARMLSIRESKGLLAQIRAFTRVDCLRLYKAVFANAPAFMRLARGLLPPDEIEPLRLYTLSRLEDGPLPYEDAVAVAYLEARVNGCRAYARLRQVVVDEVQDLDSLHAALLALLFPNARYTLLGDVHQTLAGQPDPALYDKLQKALGKQESMLVTLSKSFRCTREIWAFSAQFLPPGEAGECFSRSGEEPVIFHAPDEGALDALVLRHARTCLADGCQSVALLCKTQQDAQELSNRLTGAEDVALIGPEDAIGKKPISIVPLYMAKGLEFDAVLLYGVDAVRYGHADDKNLLYIGCTRALHILRLFYTGERSPFLPGDAEVKA